APVDSRLGAHRAPAAAVSGRADRRQRRPVLRSLALEAAGPRLGRTLHRRRHRWPPERRIRPGRLARRPATPERPLERHALMATKKPKGLGRGLEALLGPTAAPSADPGGPLGGTSAEEGAAPQNPNTLKLDQMVAGVYQPRTRM